MNIYLIGFMAVGKTTLGKRLAKAMQRPFIDTDKLIAQRTLKTIDEIFETLGEDEFRKIEADTLRSITENNAIIATGGGLPCYFNNMDFMNTQGVTIYLRANSAFIYNRLLHAKAPRPLLKELKLDELLAFIEAKLAARQPYYLQSKLVQDMPLKSVETLVNTMIEQGL